MRILPVLACFVLVIAGSYLLGKHRGYVEGVIETTADFLSDNPSAVCSLRLSPSLELQSYHGPSEPL